MAGQDERHRLTSRYSCRLRTIALETGDVGVDAVGPRLAFQDAAQVWPQLGARHPGDALDLDHKLATVAKSIGRIQRHCVDVEQIGRSDSISWRPTNLVELSRLQAGSPLPTLRDRRDTSKLACNQVRPCAVLGCDHRSARNSSPSRQSAPTGRPWS